MKFLMNFILYFYLFLPSSAVYKKRVQLKTTTDGYNSTSEPTLTTQMYEKDFKQPTLMKMLLITTSKDSCNCNCSKNAPVSSTEQIRRSPLGFKVVMRNKPEKYRGGNTTISRLCPYFVPNAGFKMYKMAAVYWPRFYNLKDNLNCFEIHVLRLSEEEMKENELKYGNFSGKVDWTQCHFEIKPPELFSRRRHFLMGGINEKGVMRNILISYNANGGFSLHEEVPDQWLMLRNLVLLRDCSTGEVVVFTKSPQLTSSGDVVQALQYLGEEMIGKMLCDDQAVNWLDQAA